jgi:hypothetical protein
MKEVKQACTEGIGAQRSIEYQAATIVTPSATLMNDYGMV